MSRGYNYALAITSQFYFCALPFRLDISPFCSLGCTYCFHALRGGNSQSISRLADPERVVRKLVRIGQLGAKPADVVEEFLAHRMPIHFGGVSDPFADDDVSRRALRILRALADLEYPVVISTKNPLRLVQPDALETLARIRHLAVQVSFSTIAAREARALESGAPTPSQRLDAATILARQGIHLIARLQPLFPSLVSAAATEVVPALAEAGFRHVVVECLKVPLERTARDALGSLPEPMRNDLRLFDSGCRMKAGREWLLPTQLRWDLLQPVIASIRSRGMTYGSADYGLLHLGDTDTCCGIAGLQGFENWNRASITHAVRVSGIGPVSFDSVAAEWSPSGTVKRSVNSRCRIPGSQTALDYLRAKWDSPGTTNAPDSYLGVSFEGERDEHDACVYARREVVAQHLE